MMSAEWANTLYLDSVAIIAPAIDNWEDFTAVLSGAGEVNLLEDVDPKPAVLPAAIRRRASRHIRLAVAVADQALQKTTLSGDALPAIFASSENDGATIDEICLAVVDADPMVSPTRFHNSVNNAAVGNWSITQGLKLATTSVLSFDGPAAVGLVEAAGQLLMDSEQVLLVVHDSRPPPRLQQIRPFIASFATAFIFTRYAGDGCLAELDLALASDALPASTMRNPALEALRLGNPAATALPLLAALAQAESDEVSLPYVDGCSLQVRVRPC